MVRVSIPFTASVTSSLVRAVIPEIRIISEDESVCEAEIHELDRFELTRNRIPFTLLSSSGSVSARPATDRVERATPDPWIASMVNAVAQDSIVRVVGALQSFVTRDEYMPQQDAAGDYLLEQLRRRGYQAEADSFVFLTGYMYDGAVLGRDSILLCSYGKFLFSADAGRTWQLRYGPLRYESPVALDFVDRNNGWAVGDSRLILHTSDGGVNWDMQNIALSQDLRDVDFVTADIGIAVGGYWYSQDRKILRTSDGGKNWLRLPSTAGQYTLSAIEFIDQSHAWAVGRGGSLIFSSDAGVSWSDIALPGNPYHDFYAMEFVDPAHGWIVGNDTTVIQTTDGGINWSILPVPGNLTTGFLRGITFADTATGWMFDHHGSIFKTRDGGATWKSVLPSLRAGWSSSISSIRFLGPGSLIATGRRGAFFSSDSGETWEDLSSLLPEEMIHRSRNIVATIPGSVTPDTEYVAVAHYDSYSWGYAPGANDNASGVSAVLEAARICRQFQFASTIRFLAVAAEELGMIGSSKYVEKAVRQGRSFAGVVNADMIGYPTTANPARLVVGSFLSPNSIVDSAIAYNTRYSIGLTLETLVDSTGASDYGPFALAGFDALDIGEDTPQAIWDGADPHYHTESDLLEHLRPDLMRRGCQLMLATLAELAKPLGPISNVISTISPPSEFSLSQNYPNPFNPHTLISFQVPRTSKVRLVVFDILGRVVAKLADDYFPAGFYEVPWEAHNLTSGIYFYRLEAVSVSGKEFNRTNRMLLLK